MEDIKEAIIGFRKQQVEFWSENPNLVYRDCARLLGMTEKQYGELLRLAADFELTKIKR